MAQVKDVLRSVPFFSRLDDDLLRAIEGLVMERTFYKGELLFMEGGECPGLYIVKSGLVRIFKTSPEGKEQVLLIARPGESFNEVPVFDGGPNPASAEAMERTTVYILPSSDLLELVRRRPDITLELLKTFAVRLRRLTMLVEDLSFRHVTSRLARLLLEVAESQAGSGPPRRLTQQQMAAIVGTAREMVGRSLKTFEQAGAIRIEGRRIKVVKPEILRKML